jgi:hypothetical protein
MLSETNIVRLLGSSSLLRNSKLSKIPSKEDLQVLDYLRQHRREHRQNFSQNQSNHLSESGPLTIGQKVQLAHGDLLFFRVLRLLSGLPSTRSTTKVGIPILSFCSI